MLLVRALAIFSLLFVQIGCLKPLTEDEEESLSKFLSNRNKAASLVTQSSFSTDSPNDLGKAIAEAEQDGRCEIISAVGLTTDVQVSGDQCPVELDFSFAIDESFSIEPGSSQTVDAVSRTEFRIVDESLFELSDIVEINEETVITAAINSSLNGGSFSLSGDGSLVSQEFGDVDISYSGKLDISDLGKSKSGEVTVNFSFANFDAEIGILIENDSFTYTLNGVPLENEKIISKLDDFVNLFSNF